MITNVAIEKIHPHPNNPRKDLGDLSELVESIKANGVLQNLTIVPDDLEHYHKKINGKKAYTGEYTAIIGHRRLAASKLAGLTELPCSIAFLDEKTQVSMMLLENMQRSDLTYWEQAQGFQMMLDMGETEADIVAKTGFSNSTVRRRVKLLELDQEKFKKSEERGATLEDYAKLEKIEDLEARNRVLDAVGTTNFGYQLQKALDEQKWIERKASIIEQLKGFATELPDYVDQDDAYDVDYETIEFFTRWYNDADVEVPADAEQVQYFYRASDDRVELLIRECDIKEDEEERQLTPEEINRKRKQEKRYALNEISERAYKLRCDFIRNFSASKTHSATIMEIAIRNIFRSGYGYFNKSLMMEMLGVDIGERPSHLCSFEDIAEVAGRQPERVMLIAAYCNGMDGNGKHYYNWECEYQPNSDLDVLYDCLQKLGYEMSDDERALRNGTHELFHLEEPDIPEVDPCITCKAAHPSCDGCCEVCANTCNSAQKCHRKIAI